MQVTQYLSFPALFSSIQPPPEEWEGQLFLSTNEERQEATLQEVRKISVMPRSAMLFTSGMCGLNIASARGLETDSEQGVDYLIVVDCATKVQKFWNEIKPIIMSHDREATILKIQALIKEKKEELLDKDCDCGRSLDYHADKDIKKITKQIDEGASWLSSDRQFSRIQKIFQENKFAFVLGDLGDQNTTEAIASRLSESNLVLDTIYVSNIREYVEYDGALEEFQSAMEQLKRASTPETLVIDTHLRFGGMQGEEPLWQQVRRGFVSLPASKFFPASPAEPEISWELQYTAVLEKINEGLRCIIKLQGIKNSQELQQHIYSIGDKIISLSTDLKSILSSYSNKIPREGTTLTKEEFRQLQIEQSALRVKIYEIDLSAAEALDELSQIASSLQGGREDA